MIPKIFCAQCNSEVQSADKFCSNCGSEIEWDRHEKPISIVDSTKAESFQCRLCGHLNSPDAAYCDACGAAQVHKDITPQFRNPKSETPASTAKRGERNPKSQVPARTAKRGERNPKSQYQVLRILQSWKLTLGIALIFIIVLVVVGLSRNQHDHVQTTTPSNLSTQAAQVVSEIEQLQQHVNANPDDMRATLRLANLLHDVKFFPRAVMMYQRYLRTNPSNPDARVDMGICYFEMSMTDSARRTEYLTAARDEMKKALAVNPQHQLAHFNLGIVNLQSGNLEEANMWFKKCIDLNPNSDTGKRAQKLYRQHSFTNGA